MMVEFLISKKNDGRLRGEKKWFANRICMLAASRLTWGTKRLPCFDPEPAYESACKRVVSTVNMNPEPTSIHLFICHFCFFLHKILFILKFCMMIDHCFTCPYTFLVEFFVHFLMNMVATVAPKVQVAADMLSIFQSFASPRTSITKPCMH